MEKFPTWICVVALALADGEGRWLMHRRPPGKHHAGLWEFPGGKVDAGETPREALIREIREELGLALAVEGLSPAGFAEETRAEARAPIVIMLYTSVWNGSSLAALEGGEIGWFTAQEVARLDKPPLDVALAADLFEKT
ncbi:(deoxy)nucleoside triphosphate pyrophosphohydrolase [Qipengyuania mesophila]|uniref:(deoxy)nucleoside triphosphate pyrophosphohydrolase n=1 Tax=Qipengyuania mesophila TaxID=2867246 RepID=UPI002494DA76|nr:(deoxy)nucleoside triphosphate pyrophosphohydrolase [Qipengyuania mesophila]